MLAISSWPAYPPANGQVLPPKKMRPFLSSGYVSSLLTLAFTLTVGALTTRTCRHRCEQGLLPATMRFRSAIAVLSQPPFLAPISGLQPFETASEHGAISRRVFPPLVLCGRWCTVLSGHVLGGVRGCSGLLPGLLCRVDQS